MSDRITPEKKKQVSRLVNFEADEFARIEKAASLLGLSFSSYLRLTERLCAKHFLSVWHTILDFRAEQFVERAVGVRTKRYGIPQNEGIQFIEARLEKLRANLADAEMAIKPPKPQRAEWAPFSFEGSSDEQWFSANLFDARTDVQEKALAEVEGPLTDYFYQAVDRHRTALLHVVQLQNKIIEKYTGDNRRLAEDYQRALNFVEEAQLTLKSKKPLGYRRFRLWASVGPSPKYPAGRGYIRWQVQKMPIGGNSFYDDLRKCPKPRLPAALRNQLKAWKKYCQSHLKNLEKWQKSDQARLAKIRKDSNLWFDVGYLQRILGQEHEKPKNVTRRNAGALPPEMKIQPEKLRKRAAP